MLYHSYDTIPIASANEMFVTHRDLIAETCLIVFKFNSLDHHQVSTHDIVATSRKLHAMCC